MGFRFTSFPQSTHKIFSAWLDEWADFLMSCVRIIQASAGNETLSRSFALRLSPEERGLIWIAFASGARSTCVHTFSVFAQQVRSQGHDARLFPPAPRERESYFSFALILKVKSEQQQLYEICSRQQKMCAQWRANEMHSLGKKAVLLAREH